MTPKDIILQVIREKQGDKGVAIAVACAARFAEEGIDVDVPTLLEELVEEKQLIEVEYQLPPHGGQDLSYKMKSFYLPANSKVELRGASPPLCWIPK